MAPSRQTILVAGAGIAGLTTALAIAATGRSVTVLERTARLAEVGAGLQIPPNASRLLARYGVLDHLGEGAFRPVALDMRNAASGRLAASLPLGDLAERRWGAPYLAAHRADLLEALADAARAHPSIELELGAEVVDAVADGEGVTVTIERAVSRMERTGAALIGADGVWSRLRRRLRADAASRFSGHVAWRTTLPRESAPAGLFAADRITVFFSPRFHLVAYPVRGGNLINLVAVTAGDPARESWNIAAPTTRLAEALEGSVLAGLAQAGSWNLWPLHMVDWSGAWQDGRVALVGDAAHALTPFAAQGAAMAIEDAAVLAECLADDATIATAFLRYEERRKPRIARVARRGSFNRFAWHAAGPVALARDLILALRPGERMLSDFDWLYGATVTRSG